MWQQIHMHKNDLHRSLQNKQCHRTPQKLVICTRFKTLKSTKSTLCWPIYYIPYHKQSSEFKRRILPTVTSIAKISMISCATHRHRRRGAGGGSCLRPKKIWGKNTFWAKIMQNSGILLIFGGTYHVKFGNFVIFWQIPCKTRAFS